MRLFNSLITIVTLAVLSVASFLVMGGGTSAAPQKAEKHLYIVSPTDGAQVSNPVTVRFGLRGMGVAPAGVDRDNTGHHHLLIDVDQLPDLTKPVPADDNHRHFGGGQTEVTLELAPGEHSLQLLLGDKYHRPHSEPLLSKKIQIRVE